MLGVLPTPLDCQILVNSVRAGSWNATVPLGASYVHAVSLLVEAADAQNWLRDLVQRLVDTFPGRSEFSAVLAEIDHAAPVSTAPDPFHEVPQSELPDFSNANGQQLRLLRGALVKTTKASGLDMVLSATRDSRLADLVAPGPFQEQVFELLDLARREGWMNELVHAALAQWPRAPELAEWCRLFR